MRRLYSVLFLFTTYNSVAQNLQRLGTLDFHVHESSGLEYAGQGRFWTLNDGGNSNELFLIDSSGELLRTLTLNGFPNIDWESLCADDKGNLYIGDFGNNDQTRVDLRIGILSEAQSRQDTATPAILQFSYPGQIHFPPPVGERYFDCEAILHIGDSLYLFTKNDMESSDGTSLVYALPDRGGTVTARLCTHMHTGRSGLTGLVTGAALDTQYIYLLGYNFLWKLSNSGLSRFELLAEYSFGNLAQREGLCMDEDGLLYITEEKLLSEPGLYRLDPIALGTQNMMHWAISISNGCVLVWDPGNKISRLSFFDIGGRLLASSEYRNNEPRELCRNSGNTEILFLEVTHKNGKVEYAKILW